MTALLLILKNTRGLCKTPTKTGWKWENLNPRGKKSYFKNTSRIVFQKLKTHVQQVEKMRVNVMTLPQSLFFLGPVRTTATCAHPHIYAHNHTLKPPGLPVKIRNQSARVISYA